MGGGEKKKENFRGGVNSKPREGGDLKGESKIKRNSTTRKKRFDFRPSPRVLSGVKIVLGGAQKQNCFSYGRKETTEKSGRRGKKQS